MILRTDQKAKLLKFLRSNISARYIIGYIALGILLLGSYYISYKIPQFQQRFIDKSIEYKSIFNSSLYRIVVLYIISLVFSLLNWFFPSLLKSFYNRKLQKKMFDKVIHLRKERIASDGVGHYYSILTNDTENVSNILELTPFKLIFSSLRCLFILMFLANLKSNSCSHCCFSNLCICYDVLYSLNI